jgi:hypothetical protein
VAGIGSGLDRDPVSVDQAERQRFDGPVLQPQPVAEQVDARELEVERLSRGGQIRIALLAVEGQVLGAVAHPEAQPTGKDQIFGHVQARPDRGFEEDDLRGILDLVVSSGLWILEGSSARCHRIDGGAHGHPLVNSIGSADQEERRDNEL